MSRHPVVVERRRKTSRSKKERRVYRQEAKSSCADVEVPAAPVISKTQQKRIDRQELATQEQAERKLEKLDQKWGFGLGPFKARLKWVSRLLGG